MTLLAVADYKGIVGSTSATDVAIQAALDAAEEVILDAVGPIGDQTEHSIGGHSQIMLGRRAKMILGVSERIGSTLTELDPSDYHLSTSGGYVVRLTGGVHPRARWPWNGQVEIRYEPFVGINLVLSVQVELVALDVGDSIGANAGQRTQERIGEWTESFASTSVALNPEQRREAILARLIPSSFPYWVRSGHSAVPGSSGS